MDLDNPALLALVRAVCDGSAVDWDTALDHQSEWFRGAVAELRVVADLVNLNRSLEGETDRRPPAAPPVESFSPGPSLGRWGHLHLLEHVASGSFGDVYRAWDPAIDREVALKLLRSRHSRNQNADDESIEEGRLLARVRHPNVVTVYGAARIEGRVGIWMEFIHGHTLNSVVRQEGPLGRDTIARIGSELSDAVAAVHDAGLLHRDIKAQNVMLADDGRVVLMDLGAGRVVGNDLRDIVGTPLYLAPEIVEGHAPSIRSDVFSIGVLLHFLGTGRFPVHAGGAALDERLKPIVARATAREPRARYTGARELGHELRALLLPPSHTKHRVRFASIAAMLLVAASVAVWRLMPVSASMPAPRVAPLTSMPGAQGFPTFSPDGSQVAFEWWSDKDEDYAIYVKKVGSPEVRRLVKGASGPSWSPDGRHIAFNQSSDQRVQLISPEGGSVTTVGDFEGARTPSWSADSRYLAVARAPLPPRDERGIYLISVDTGASRLIARSFSGDFNPAFSPDGRRLAYVSASERGVTVNVIDLDATLNPVDAPRRVTGYLAGVGRITWTPDGRDLIYSGNGWPEGWRHPLWRVPADGSRPPETVQTAGPSALDPAISPSGNRLAFRIGDDAREVYRFVAGGAPVAVLLSSFVDGYPSFSSNGARLVFSSSRAADSTDIWIANADGSDPRPVTHGPGNVHRWPRWSPDDQQIVFASQKPNGPDGVHLWLVNEDGSSARQVTSDAGNQTNPSWSHDGRWIYFTQNSPTGSRIWRIPASGGRASPVIQEPAIDAFESADGRALLYDNGENSPLRMLPLTGGVPRTLLDCENGFAPATTGIYYLTCVEASKSRSVSRPDIRWLNPETGENRLLGSVDRQDTLRDVLAVSPDESAILYSRWNPGTAGLWMVENFR
jgi:Tol biopolymer transport system component/tRNA A-37 threonylcarbamoyl transferase component Bud32